MGTLGCPPCGVWSALLSDPKVPLVGTYPAIVLPYLFLVKDQIIFFVISDVLQADTFCELQ